MYMFLLYVCMYVYVWNLPGKHVARGWLGLLRTIEAARYVYIHVCMCTCICMYVCVWNLPGKHVARGWLGLLRTIEAARYVYICVCMCTCICICFYICLYVCMCVEFARQTRG
jgi:hypothetical protein